MRRWMWNLRRCGWIAWCIVCLGAVAAAAQAADPAPARSPPAARSADILPLADGVWLLPGRFERGRQPDGNSLLL